MNLEIETKAKLVFDDADIKRVTDATATMKCNPDECSFVFKDRASYLIVYKIIDTLRTIKVSG